MVNQLELTEEEKKRLEILLDPVKWAAYHFGWKARYYQEEILRCEDNLIVLRMGRRIGKTDSMAVKALYYAYTKPGKQPQEPYKVLIFGPMEKQITLIFDRMRQLIRMSPEMLAAVGGNPAKIGTKSPQTIAFPLINSSIVGVTAGTKAGAQALQARGEGGDVIILDEADYLVEKDVDSIMGIRLQNPTKIKILAASTPTGRRAHFWRWCQPGSGWHQFYYPSTVMPEWSPEIEEQFRNDLTHEGFIHEVLAEFGEETGAVFGKRFIDHAVEVWKQGDFPYVLGPYDTFDFPKRGPRVLGTDWDKYHSGTNIIVLEYRLDLGVYAPIYREEIPMSEFTLDNAVRRIIVLNQALGLDLIVCDRGFGEYQVETLKRYGMEHPETGIVDKVIPVNFSQSVSVRDPWTQKKDKKPLKPFMVNQVQLAFERHKVVLPPSEVDKQLIKQLSNYRVVNIGTTGQPIYNDEEEHIVDAFDMAIYGFVVRFSDIINGPQEEQRARLAKPYVTPAPALPSPSSSDTGMGIYRPRRRLPRQRELLASSVLKSHRALIR